MREYANVSRLATHHPGTGGGPVVPAAESSAFSWLVQRYVRAHIRRRLRALQDAYTELALAVTEPSYSEWLSDAQAGVTSWLARLPRSRLPLFAAIPFLSPAAGALDSDPWAYALGVLPVLLIFGWFVVWPALLDSYSFKRELFLPGVSVFEAEGLDPPETARNVYAVEDELFAVLGRRKPGEVRVDALLRFGFVLLVMEAFIIVGSIELIHSLLWMLLIFAGFGIGLLAIRRLARRTEMTFS